MTSAKAPVLLTTANKPVRGYRKSYVTREANAIAKAGFEVIELNNSIFGLVDPPDVDLTGRTVVCRHYAGDDRSFIKWVEANGGTLATPNYAATLHWYKIMRLDNIATKYWFLGGRNMAWYSLAPYGYLETKEEMAAFKEFIGELYYEPGKYVTNGRVFVKADVKGALAAKIYTKEELYETLSFLIGVGCHNTPRELLVSEPMAIAPANTKYKKDEYRCLIVDNKVSTVSLYTDRKANRDYTRVIKFANWFAEKYAGKMPNSYDLDICRREDNSLAVVELNDIAACGFFADHDLDKLFADLYKLAQNTLQNH